MKKTIFKAVFTLTAFTLVERILGFLFKIYLSRQMGAVAMGVYSVALSFFLVLITMTNSGIPLVVSKLTAKVKKRGVKETASLTSAALIIELGLAAIICAIVLIARNGFKYLFADPQSMTLVLIMLPAVVFSGVYSAFRGSIWGQQHFVTVSLVELIEQIARILSCVILFFLFENKIQMSALSMTIGCFVAAFAAFLFYIIFKGKFANPKRYFKPLIKSSTPIIFSRTSSSVNNYMIAVLIPFLLITAGKTSEQSMYIFGVSVGMALPLLFLPITIVGSLAFVLIPTLSEAFANNDKKSVQSQIETAIKFSVIISAAFLPFYYALGETVGVLIYDNIDSGKFLSISSFLLIPLSVENIVSSMMNSLDLERKSFINYLLGSALLFGILLISWGRFEIEIYAYALAGSLTLSSLLDIIDIKRKSGISLGFIRTLIFCSLLCIPSIYFTQWVYNILPFGNFLCLMIAGILSFIFMALGMLIFGLFDLDYFFAHLKKTKAGKRIKN